MFARASSAFMLALPVLAAASVLPRTDDPSNQCNTGTTYCCNSAVAPNDPSVTTILGTLGVAVGSITGQVGVTCSPLTLVGASASSCSQQPVCCTGNNFSGIVVIGCTTIIL